MRSKGNILIWVLFSLMMIHVWSASKALSQNCFCDVSTSCDQQCCCDSDCSAQATTYWSDYSLCANDGFNIPFCSSIMGSPLHVHDLSQGLRLIYTVVKRMFCISRVNFVTPSVQYTTTSTDQQVPVMPANTPAVNPYVLALTASTTFTALPMRNSLGGCTASALRDMDSISQGQCRVNVATTTAIATNAMLNPSTFASANGLNASALNVFRMKSTSLTAAGTASAVTLGACTVSGTTNICQTIKQVKLFFVKGTATTIDYTSSYLVLAQTYVNNPTNILIQYSYQFMASATSFPFPSYQGYSMGSPLNLLLSTTAGVTTTDTKMFNPINLAFRTVNGACRTAATDTADSANLAHLRFGINTVYSCVGTSSTFWTSNIISMFNYIGMFGISSTNIHDYVLLSTSNIAASQNIHLLFDYLTIGTELEPQYQIVQAKLQPAGTVTTQVKMFVQFQAVSTGVTLNVPPPPTIDATLPSDFLYPFYVA